MQMVTRHHSQPDEDPEYDDIPQNPVERPQTLLSKSEEEFAHQLGEQIRAES